MAAQTLYDGIDVAILPVSDLAAACAPFERLGLTLSAGERHVGLGTQNRMLPVGGPENLFSVELLGIADRAEAGANEAGRLALARADTGLAMIGLRVADLDAALATLAGRGLQAPAWPLHVSDGTKVADVAILPVSEDAATGLFLVRPAKSAAERHAEYTGGRPHRLPLKRLDHLAAVAPDLERSCRYWDEVLGVPVVGEVVSPTTVVRQLRIGDAMFELLGPATPDSPIRQRTPGLGSMCSFEVPDLAAAVAHARAAGFTIPDPARGTLPGTIVATIPGAETSGLNVQLLQYV